MATDAVALLRFGAANGFSAAAWGLVRTLLSNYWRLRSKLGLTRYANAAMIEKLDAAGFNAGLAPANIGHNQARIAFYVAAAVSGYSSRNMVRHGRTCSGMMFRPNLIFGFGPTSGEQKAARDDLAGGLVKVGCVLSGSDFILPCGIGRPFAARKSL